MALEEEDEEEEQALEVASLPLNTQWNISREQLLSRDHFRRQDEDDDPLFYRQPRLVVHIDEGAIAAVSHLLARFIPPDAETLDLLSSYRSHWPAHHPKKRLVGLGLNAVEMEHNPDLDSHVVHDVNRDATLPFPDASFDAVVITVSMQYLTRPVETLREVQRVLRPGGRFLALYSNRMFHTKAVYIWMVCSDQQRACLIATYLEEAGGFTPAEGFYVPPQSDTPGEGADPIYAVLSRKAAEGQG